MQMIKRVQAILVQNKTIVNNFSYLSILQFINLLIPLITYPFLIRVIGSDLYGGIVFAQALIGYFAIIIGFGFNISATKNISIHKKDSNKLSEIVSSVLIIKAYLFIFSFIGLVILLKFIDLNEFNEILFYLTMYLCIQELLFPIWYFQGMQKMQYITLFTLLSKLVFVILIFILIKSKEDYLLVPIINGIGVMLSGVLSLYVIFKLDKVKFRWQKNEKLFYYIKDSFSLFLSNAMVLIKEKTNILFIGLFLNMTDVAYYDIALKITTLLRTPFMLVRDSIFPSIAISKNKVKYIKISIITIIISLFAYLLLLIFSEQIIYFLGGEEMLPSVKIIPLMGLTIPIGVLSMFLGSALIIFNNNKQYGLSILYSLFSFIFGLITLYLLNLFSLKSLIMVIIFSLLIEIIVRTHFIKKNEK